MFSMLVEFRNKSMEKCGSNHTVSKTLLYILIFLNNALYKSPCTQKMINQEECLSEFL